MKCASDFFDYTYEVYPKAASRWMQAPLVKIEMWDGIVHQFDFSGLIEMTDEQLDKRYTNVFNRAGWHLTREAYILKLAREQAKSKTA